MYKYLLKDKELQAKFEAIDPKFGEYLNEEATYNGGDDISGISISFGPEVGIDKAYTAWFEMSELEKIPEYDPKKWNNYPEVTPPEGIWFRCEGFAERFSARYRNGNFVDPTGAWRVVDRFRPWED